ncbi:MAG: hypothetical protein LBU34_08195 [Planctomycetaceae bacterium]|jgi:hypothetical protein|nr:hypothetical protein [Planctomycetaceae bacterium]
MDNYPQRCGGLVYVALAGLRFIGNPIRRALQSIKKTGGFSSGFLVLN